MPADSPTVAEMEAIRAVKACRQRDSMTMGRPHKGAAIKHAAYCSRCLSLLLSARDTQVDAAKANESVKAAAEIITAFNDDIRKRLDQFGNVETTDA